ncbi:MAG: lipid-A-disaccharide synthase [bacterium]
MGKVVVIAGEVSGDMHAARVIREIKRLAPATEISGMGSSCLQQEGVNVIIDPTQINVIGFLEALKNIKVHLSHLRTMEEHIEKEKPDVLFLVDYSGFNMFMARMAKKKGIPAVSFFPPSAWVWGRWRAKWMSRTGVKIAAAFPRERNVYLEAGASVEFVGHPLLDMVEVTEDNTTIYKKLAVDPKKPVIALLPGSRNSEIESLLPEMLQAAEKIQKEREEAQFILPLAEGIDKSEIIKELSKYNLVIKVVKNYTYPVMKTADFLITASGTATLEAAILKTPMIIIYKTSNFSYQLGKRLLKVDNIGMPNIIANNKVVPELLQQQVTAEKIYEEALNFLNRPYLISGMVKKLERIKDMLGEEGATTRTAELVLKEGDLDYGAEK